MVLLFMPTLAQAAGSVAALTCHQSLDASLYPNCALLRPFLALHWAIHDRNGGPTDASSAGNATSRGVADRITFAIETTIDLSSQWIALGISDAGGMMGADIAALEKRPEGWAVTDMFSSDYDAPVRDAVAQDVVLLQEPEKTEEGTWVFMYKRPLETGDVDDRDILEGEDQNFNASSNASNRAYGQGPTMNDHGDHRGYSRLQLYPYDIWEDSTGIDITDGADALAASVDLINIGEGVANAAAKVPSKVIELDGVDGFDGNEMPAERDCAAAEFVLAGVAMAMMMLGALRAGWSTEISAAGFMRGLVLDVDEEAGKVAVDGGEKRRMETKGRME